MFTKWKFCYHLPLWCLKPVELINSVQNKRKISIPVLDPTQIVQIKLGK